METVLISNTSKENVKLITAMAKKLGSTIKALSEEDLEDMGLLIAMKKGSTGEYVDTDNFPDVLISDKYFAC